MSDSNPSAKYPCDICPAVLASKWGLSQHKIVIHTGDYKFKCAQCNKGFTIPSKLKKHEEKYCKSGAPQKHEDTIVEKSEVKKKHEETPVPVIAQTPNPEPQKNKESKTKFAKRTRHVLTEEQIQAMEATFEAEPMWGNMTPEIQAGLQQNTGLEKKVIRTWFANRNAKRRRGLQTTAAPEQDHNSDLNDANNVLGDEENAIREDFSNENYINEDFSNLRPNDNIVSEQSLKIELMQKVKYEVSEDVISDVNQEDSTVTENYNEMENDLENHESEQSDEIGDFSRIHDINSENSLENFVQEHGKINYEDDNGKQDVVSKLLPKIKMEEDEFFRKINLPHKQSKNVSSENDASQLERDIPPSENDWSLHKKDVPEEILEYNINQYIKSEHKSSAQVKTEPSEDEFSNLSENPIGKILSESHLTDHTIESIMPENDLLNHQKDIPFGENQYFKIIQNVKAEQEFSEQYESDIDVVGLDSDIIDGNEQKVNSVGEVCSNNINSDNGIEKSGVDEYSSNSEKSGEFYLEIIRKAARFDDITRQFNAKSEEELDARMMETKSKASKYDELKMDFETLEQKYLKSYKKIKALEDSGIDSDSRDFPTTPTSMNSSGSQNTSSPSEGSSSPECSSTPINKKKRNNVLNESSQIEEKENQTKQEHFKSSNNVVLSCIDLDSNVNSGTNLKQSTESPVNLLQSRFESQQPKNGIASQFLDKNSQMASFQPSNGKEHLGDVNAYNQLPEAMHNFSSNHINAYNQTLQPNFGYGLDPQVNGGYNQIPQLNSFNPNPGYNQQQNLGYNQLNQTEIIRYQQMQQPSNNSYNNSQFPHLAGMYPFNQTMQQQYNLGNLNQMHNLYNQPLNNSVQMQMAKLPLNQLAELVNSQPFNKSTESYPYNQTNLIKPEKNEAQIISQDPENQPLDLTKTSPMNLSKSSMNPSKTPLNLAKDANYANQPDWSQLNQTMSEFQKNIVAGEATNIGKIVQPLNPVSKLGQPKLVQPYNAVPKIVESLKPNPKILEPLDSVKPLNAVPKMIQPANSIQTMIQPVNTISKIIETANPIPNMIQPVNPVSKIFRPVNPVAGNEISKANVESRTSFLSKTESSSGIKDGTEEKPEMWVCATKEGFPEGWKKQSIKKNDRSKKDGFYFRLQFMSPQNKVFKSRKAAIEYMTSSNLYSENQTSVANGWPKRRKSMDAHQNEGGPSKRRKSDVVPSAEDGWKDAEGLPSGWKMKPTGSWRPGGFTYKNGEGKILRSGKAVLEHLKNDPIYTKEDVYKFEKVYLGKISRSKNNDMKKTEENQKETGVNVTGVLGGTGMDIPAHEASVGAVGMGNLNPFPDVTFSYPDVTDALRSLQNIQRISVTKC